MDDHGSVLVIILNYNTKQCNNNIGHLKWLFSDPYFTVRVYTIYCPQKSINNPLIDNYYMKKALKYAADGPKNSKSDDASWKNIPCIIIKDDSVSNLCPDHVVNINGIKTRIRNALSKAPSADLLFLCKCNDQCEQYEDIVKNDSTIKWSTNPTSTQAILYKPHARDIILNLLKNSSVTLGDLLNSQIQHKKIKALVFVPNLISFDISLSTSSLDYNKVNECQNKAQTTATDSTTTIFVWFAVFVILLCIVCWIMAYI